MSDYRAPVADMLFDITELAGLADLQRLPGCEDTGPDLVAQVLEEAARFAGEVLAPLNRGGDTQGTKVVDRRVVPADGFGGAYRAFVDGGWAGLPGPSEYGGQGLPQVLAIPVAEMWAASNLAFSLCPMLTQGAVDALRIHGSPELQAQYLPQLVSGEWTGTMNLTEPQAGSDLAAVTTKAVPQGDHYLVSGQKIYITWGDHDMASNIIHMVLARVPGGPPGTKGLSLFLVPKILPDGRPNDVLPVSVEHKLGINGSPTCVMSYGESGGAVGWLVGDLHNGMACMFTMMNEARIAVGLEGVGLADRAYQQARTFARERVQGSGPDGKRVPIIRHADVRRMLLQMRAQTEAARAVTIVAAAAVDVAQRSPDAAARAQAEARVALLTPIVKAWCTEIAQEVTSLGVQVHGGMGFIEETGAAQHMRDARITPIYEGTNGIQALDLVGRKILRDGGKTFMALLTEMKAVASDAAQSNDPDVRVVHTHYSRALESFERSAMTLLELSKTDPQAVGAGAFEFLMAMGTVCGGWQMTRSALAASRHLAGGGDSPFHRAKLTVARFYAEHVLPRTAAYGRSACAGSASIAALADEEF